MQLAYVNEECFSSFCVLSISKHILPSAHCKILFVSARCERIPLFIAHYITSQSNDKASEMKRRPSIFLCSLHSPSTFSRSARNRRSIYFPTLPLRSDITRDQANRRESDHHLPLPETSPCVTSARCARDLWAESGRWGQTHEAPPPRGQPSCARGARAKK